MALKAMPAPSSLSVFLSLPLSLYLSLSLLVWLAHFRFMTKLWSWHKINLVCNDLGQKYASCRASPDEYLCMYLLLSFWICGFMLSYKQPVNTQTDLQLTHWLGMATDVSMSAMAPNIWSVRPWFFCRAFILPQNQAKGSLRLFSSAVVTFDLQLLHKLSLSQSLSLCVCLSVSSIPRVCLFSAPSALVSLCHSLEQSLHSPPCSTLTHRKPHAYE